MIKPWQLAVLLVVGGGAFLLARLLDPGSASVADAGRQGDRALAEGGAAWVLHYRPRSVGRAVYEDLVRSLPAGDHLVLAAQDGASLEEARRAWSGRITVELAVDAHLSPWARDRYILFRRDGRVVCLAPPPSSLPANQQGDGDVPDMLVRAGSPIELIRSTTLPVGGDTVITPHHVLVGDHSIERVRRAMGGSAERAVASLEALFGLSAFVVPTYALGIDRLHLDMVVGHAGGRRLVVGDPRLAWEALDGARWVHDRFGIFDRVRNDAVTRGADELAGRLVQAGYTVDRVPMLVSEVGPGGRPPIVLTGANAVVRSGAVLLPAYGLEAFDAAAARVWGGLGLKVRPIRCAESILAGGAVRCLLNRLPE